MKEVIDELMAKFDTDGDGGVSYNEFAEFVKPKNVVDLTNVADHNNRGVGYFDAEHAAKIKKAAPPKPVKEATAAELEGYRAKLAEKIGTKYKLLTRAFRDIDTDHSGYLSKQEIVDAVYNFNLGASARYGSTLRAPAALFPPSCRPLTALRLPSCRHPEGARRPADRQGRRHRPRRQDRVRRVREAVPRARGRGHRRPGRRAARRVDRGGRVLVGRPDARGQRPPPPPPPPGAPLSGAGARAGAWDWGRGGAGRKRGPRVFKRVSVEEEILWREAREPARGDWTAKFWRSSSPSRTCAQAARIAQTPPRQTPHAMPPVFCSAPDLTLEELEAELGLIGSAKQILAAIAVQARLRGLVAKRRAREAALARARREIIQQVVQSSIASAVERVGERKAAERQRALRQEAERLEAARGGPRRSAPETMGGPPPPPPLDAPGGPAAPAAARSPRRAHPAGGGRRGRGAGGPRPLRGGAEGQRRGGARGARARQRARRLPHRLRHDGADGGGVGRPPRGDARARGARSPTSRTSLARPRSTSRRQRGTPRSRSTCRAARTTSPRST